jgi:hypothetical protein
MTLRNIISKQFTTRVTNQKETVEGAGMVKLPKTGKFWNKK